MRPLYRYHPLFGAFLLVRIKALLPPGQIDGIRCASARVLEESGHLEEAVELLMESREWDALARLVMDPGAASMIPQGRAQTIVAWLGRLPEEMLSQTPWLLYWLAVCRQPYDPEESRLLFERSFTLCNETGDTAGALLAWSGAVMSNIYGRHEPLGSVDLSIHQSTGSTRLSRVEEGSPLWTLRQR